MTRQIGFDPVEHSYTIDGRPVRYSVTGIMREVGITDYSSVPPDILARAAARGTAVHDAIELIEQDDLDWSTVDERIRPYLSAFLDYQRDPDNLRKVEAQEVNVYYDSAVLEYAGRCDALIRVAHGRRLVEEYKTTSACPFRSASIQLAGYRLALEQSGVEIDGGRTVWLRKDGTYRTDEPDIGDDSAAMAAWLSALRLVPRMDELAEILPDVARIFAWKAGT